MPRVGERKRGKEISNKIIEGSRWYIWAECIKCRKGRWIQERYNRAKRFTGLCHSCRSHLLGKANWKGGIKRSHGYILIQVPDHPRASRQGYVREHILIWERANGNSLPEGWVIHHYNGIKHDNRPSNLLAMPNKKHELYICSLQRRIQELEGELARQGLLL